MNSILSTLAMTFAVALCTVTGAIAAPQFDAAELIDSLGLEAADQPVRETAGWSPPDYIVVRADSAERLAWLQSAVPDVMLIAAGDHRAIERHLDKIDALVGLCDPELIRRARNTHWIQIYSAGAEHCVATLASQHDGLLLTNMQRASGPEIAEHVIGMLLAFTRGLHRYIREQPEGRWNRELVPMDERWELTGRTLLAVGLGGIGTQVARRADALGMRVIAIRNSRRDGPAYVDAVGLPEDLLAFTRRADVVVNSTPLTEATEDLFDAKFFAAMKPDAWFINVGRGGSVDTDALTAALREGELAGAGLDVTDPEPLPPDHPLWQMPNVIITPHVSAGSDLIRERLFTIVRENLRRYVAGEPLLSVVDIERGY